HKSDAVAVLRIHVRLDLEHETGKLFFLRIDRSRSILVGDIPIFFDELSAAWQRLWRPLDKTVEHFAHAEIAERGAEEYRRQLAGQVFLQIEFVAGAAHQLDLLGKTVDIIAQQRARFRTRQPLDLQVLGNGVTLAFDEHVNGVGVEVVNAAKIRPRTDWPVDRRSGDLQHAFDFIEQLDRVADIAVELVDETENRRIAQTAHIHQLDGAIFDALGAVDDHQGRIHR